jgi:membrane glycosyltransferase
MWLLMMILGVVSEVPTADSVCLCPESFNNLFYYNMWPNWVFERCIFSFDSHTCNIIVSRNLAVLVRIVNSQCSSPHTIGGEGICLLYI